MARAFTPCLAACAVLFVAAPLLAGCRATSGLSTRELVAHFQLGATLAGRAHVGHVCARPPAVRLEPLPSSASAPQAKLDEVRFRVDHATTAQVAALYRCLRGFAAVRYVDTPPDQ